MSQATELISQQYAQAANVKKVWGTIIFNVKDLIYAGGAVGNGTTDDTSAIQATVNDAVSKNATLVFFPPGSYKVTALTNTATINFVGDNATFVGYVGTITEFGVGVTKLSLLTDVDETVPPTNGQFLTYNAASSKWKPKTLAPTIVNVMDPAYGAVGDGIADDTTEIAAAITAATTNGGIVFFPPGTYITGNQTVPSNVTLSFSNGAKLSINTGNTVTINGSIDAGLHQIFSGLGTVAGNVQVSLVYPQWFGAKGDGVANDAAAIQSAINLNKPVYLSQGTFFLGSTGLTGVRELMGAGMGLTTITFNGPTQNAISISNNNWHVSDLTVTHTGSPTGGNIFNITGNYGTLERITTLNGYVAIGISNSQANKFRDLILWAFLSRGMYFTGGNNDHFVSDCFINGQLSAGGAGGGNGITLFNKAEAIMFESVEIILCNYALATDASVYGFGTRPAYCRFTACFFDSSTNGVLIDKCINMNFKGCMFGNRPANGCLVNSNTDDIVFSECTFTNCGQHGCLVSGAKRVKFLGCSFLSNSSQGAGTYNGLTIGAGVSDFIVQGCTANNVITATGFSGTQGWGILIAGGASDRYIIADNLTSGNQTGGVSDGGTGTNKRVANNY